MKFSAALIAGGQSRRMGRDKADVIVGGIALWQRQLHTLREVGAGAIMVSGPERADWRASGMRIVEDDGPGGPLRALAGLLRCASHPMLLVLAVDMPAMTPVFLKTLIPPEDTLVGSVPKIGDRYEPLAASYPLAALPLAEKCLENGAHSMQEFVRCALSQGLVRELPVAVAERSLFTNLNTPDELEEFTRS